MRFYFLIDDLNYNEPFELIDWYILFNYWPTIKNKYLLNKFRAGEPEPQRAACVLALWARAAQESRSRSRSAKKCVAPCQGWGAGKFFSGSGSWLFFQGLRVLIFFPCGFDSGSGYLFSSGSGSKGPKSPFINIIPYYWIDINNSFVLI